MGDIANEPSMEEILSSIKRIIAEEGEGAVTARTRAAARKAKAASEAPEASEEEVLELTETVAEPESAPVAKPVAQISAKAATLVSEDAALASREKLASLSALIIKPEAGDNTLEGLVREMLRPMLKEWLDANLPALVERVVTKEVARITDRSI